MLDQCLPQVVQFASVSEAFNYEKEIKMNDNEIKELALEILDNCEIMQEFQDSLWIKVDKTDFYKVMDIMEEIEE